jgi:hypothetical protein
MELSELQTSDPHEAGSEVRVMDPNTGKSTDVYIKVKGVDSVDYRRSVAEMRTFIMEAAMRGEKAETDGFHIDALVNSTIGWRGIVDNGKAYKFTKKRCKDLYASRPYIRDQIDRFITNRANFIEG